MVSPSGTWGTGSTQVRAGRPLNDGLRARAVIWPPLRLARMRCERGSVVAVLPASSRELNRRRQAHAGEISRRASVGIDVSDRGRGRTAPRTVINGMAPELAAFGLPPSRIEDRHRGLIGEHAGPGEDDRQLALIEWLQPPRGSLHPQ